MSNEPNIVTLDIETSKTIYGCYPAKKPQYLSHKDIIQDWFVICASWKYLGDDTIHSVSLLDDPERYENSHIDDYHVIKVLHEILSTADAVIGHNVDKFDWGKLLERIICHKLPPIDKPKMLDTMKMAKQAHFSYNNLDYLCQRLETSAQKRENGGNAMWMDIVRGINPKERIRECVTYCEGDVPTAEELYEILAPYMPSKLLVNRNLYTSEEDGVCPNCGSEKRVKNGIKRTLAGMYQKFLCTVCGHPYASKKKLLDI